MTLPATNPRIAYVGNNTTGTYAWTWLVYQGSDLHVAALDPQQNVHVLAYGIDWNVQTPIMQENNANGGNIVLSGTGFFTFNNGILPGGWALIIRRSVVFDQDTELGPQGAFDPFSVESTLDYLTMQTIQLQDAVGHCLQTPLDDYQTVGQNIAAASQRAGGYVIFDAYGNVYSTPALIEGVPAGGATVAGTPAVAASNLAEGVEDKLNALLQIQGTDGVTYTYSTLFGIYAGMLVSVIWPATNTVTNPVILFTIYPQTPNPPPALARAIVNKNGSALTIGQLVQGTMALLGYDGNQLRVMA